MGMPKNPPRGSACYNAKLNETLVRRIRTEHYVKERIKRMLDSEFGIEAQAKRYNVSVSVMEKVVSYQLWKHVTI